MDENQQIIAGFPSAESWKKWLAKNHALSPGIWLRFFKKDSGVACVSYDDALDIALCYGWIDGQLKKYDDQSWLRKFTPRRPRSVWSKRNRQRAEQLINTRKMQTAGLQKINAAKENGSWAAAYDSLGRMTIPQDFLDELSKNKQAKIFFDTLSKANHYSIVWRLQTAKKPETRRKRLEIIINMLSRGEKFHD